MAIFTAPRSLQNAYSPEFMTQSQMGVMNSAPHSSHPSFLHLVLLVFEAVLEVVCVSLPGYIAAKQGLFDAEAQKLVANLNVTLFTPCLSMSSISFPYHSNPLLTRASLHQAGVPAHSREAHRSRHHPGHFRCPNFRLLFMCLCCVTMPPPQETTCQLHSRHGGK